MISPHVRNFQIYVKYSFLSNTLYGSKNVNKPQSDLLSIMRLYSLFYKLLNLTMKQMTLFFGILIHFFEPNKTNNA
jgi:hypothetical protein